MLVGDLLFPAGKEDAAKKKRINFKNEEAISDFAHLSRT